MQIVGYAAGRVLVNVLSARGTLALAPGLRPAAATLSPSPRTERPG
jgi:hypothetical protein